MVAVIIALVAGCTIGYMGGYIDGKANTSEEIQKHSTGEYDRTRKYREKMYGYEDDE